VKPRVLFVARDRFRLPLDGISKRKFDALEEVLDYRMLASAPAPGHDGDGHFRLVGPFRPSFLDGALFYATLVPRIVQALRGFEPGLVIAQSPYEAAAALVARRIARSDARILAEVHGDWRASTRSYGSTWRRLFAPIGDPLARAAIRRSDAVRAVSVATGELVSRLGVDPIDTFPGFTDLEQFLERPLRPLPAAPRAIFVGVLEPHKNVDVLADAWRAVARAHPNASLHVVGVGSRSPAVERLRSELPEQVLWTERLGTSELIDAMDAATLLVLPSRSEGLSRVVTEALARARPVVGSRVSGILDLVDDGTSGLLVPPDDSKALGAALSSVLGDPALAERLSGGARGLREPWPATPRIYAERVLELTERMVPVRSAPRVLFVGRTDYRLPLGESLARKWDALSERMELRVLASGTGSDPRFELVAPRRLGGPRFYAGLTGRVARELRQFAPDVVVTESPYEAAAVELARILTRSSAKLVVEVHGDWHVSTRLYGSRYRAALGPIGDRLARWAVRRADAHRAVSEFTASLVRAEGREPATVFTAYSDLAVFTGAQVPVPSDQRVVFVGVLERYKNVEGLARAWRIVSSHLPGAHLHLIGSGTQIEVAEALAREGVEWERWVEPAEVAGALDRARALLLPSRSEGLPRVIVEAGLRGRPVIATRAGGIPDIVQDEVNGLLVEQGDDEALAAAIERVLTDDPLAERLGAAARENVSQWLATPAEYADNVRAIVDTVLDPKAERRGSRRIDPWARRAED
jgi:glycosyltransferase involved in cell wall biosynthesis